MIGAPRPRSGDTYSEEEYFELIDDAMNHYDNAWPPLDLVAGLAEYARFRRALMRWVDRQDAEYDGLAYDQEHGIE